MNLTNAAAASLIISTAMPYLVTLLKQVGWPKWANMLMTIVACGIAGTITFWATGGFNNFQWQNLLIIIAGIFVASQAAYAAYWKGTVTEAKINQSTSFIKATDPNVPEIPASLPTDVRS
jgi:hypothetical protein